jgi:cyclopropane fatty-acyl-phospholipid synthase-like methyltransferase
LWLTEWLAEALVLRPGMRVLDLGCGRAASSIFLSREFDLQVWAVDLWFSPSENFERIKDAGAEKSVFPIQADARSLPFPAGYFDAIASIDSFMYFGTDDLYLQYLACFLKPGGQLGIAGAGLTRELDNVVPAHLKNWWNNDSAYCFHSANWWRLHWEKTGLVQIQSADTLPDGWRLWLEWQRRIAPGNLEEISALDADRGSCLGYTRVVARRPEDCRLPEHVTAVPYSYSKHPLLRERA